ncbi:hypothetical protein BH23BAC1_BH23BAC1_50830 [soil metagenome]
MIKILFLRFLRKTGILKRLKIKIKTSINKKIFIIPILYEFNFNHYLNPEDHWMLQLLSNLIGNQSYTKGFIDVGVNLGQTLLKVKSVNPVINYIGFEPNPACIFYLNELIALNNFQNTEIIPVGISNRTTILKLNLFSASLVDSSASMVEGFRNESTVTKTIHVPVFRFSDINKYKEFEIGIIKIDVEGAELEVIKGFKDKIIADRPILIVEILPAYETDNAQRVLRQEEIQKILNELRYAIFRIIKNKHDFIKIEEIHEFGFHSDINLCDYIFAPSEQSEKLKMKLNYNNLNI